MYTILVVEDMDLTREDLMHLVSWENYGFRLLGGMKNGQTGLEYARRYHPDIILTDIKMPVMTGLEMVEELRKSGMDTQVILLTAYEEFGLVKHAMDLGITRFLMKYEIDEELLLKELNGCVEEIQKKQAMDSFHERSRIRLLLKGKPESEGFEKPVKWPGKTTLVLFQILDGLLETGEEELQELFQQRLPKEEFLTLRLDAGRFVILRKDGLYLSEVQDQESVRGFIRQVQYVLDMKLGLTAAAAYHGKIREAQEVSVCYQDADQILKGIVFSGGSRILETFPETSKEPLPKELSEDLEELEKSYKKQEFQDIEAILERLKGRLKKAEKSLLVWKMHRPDAFPGSMAEQPDEGWSCRGGAGTLKRGQCIFESGTVLERLPGCGSTSWKTWKCQGVFRQCQCHASVCKRTLSGGHRTYGSGERTAHESHVFVQAV